MSGSTPPAPASPGTAPPTPPVEVSGFGKFVQTYSSFLSSFVIGLAGLFATTTYQCSQAKVARQQADAQQRIAETQAENNWKIERAKILSQNLNVLATQGNGNVEQRYGVLLSLTRGNILDSELAVSYALELGKDNPDYMRIVLSNTTDKEYRRLLSAFQVTCEQRFGTQKAVEICKGDKYADRSSALAELVGDETEVALAAGKLGPLVLLKDEREAETQMLRLLWLFAPMLDDMYDRRQLQAIARFEQLSNVARLISAIVLLGVQNGDLVSSAEAAQVARFQGERRTWLSQYITSPACDPECKGKVASILLTGLSKGRDNYQTALRSLLNRPRAEVVTALNRINRRLLYCQVDGEDAVALRDRVLVPELTERLAKPEGADPALTEDLVGLLAVSPEPSVPDKDQAGPEDPAQRKAYEAFTKVIHALSPKPPPGQAPAPTKDASHLLRVYQERRNVRRLRASPPPAMKKSNFCGAADSAPDGGEGTEETE